MLTTTIKELKLRQKKKLLLYMDFKVIVSQITISSPDWLIH